MINQLIDNKAKVTIGAQIIGAGLILAAIMISFFDAVPAGFFYVTGLGVLLATLIDHRRLESLTVSASELTIKLAKREIEEKVEKAEAILEQVRQVEQRLIRTQFASIKLSRGRFASAEADIGEFQVYDMVKIYRADVSHLLDVDELKRTLRLKFVWSILGKERLDQHNLKQKPSNLIEGFSPDFKLQTRDRLEELAVADGIDIKSKQDVLDAYERFVQEDKIPSDTLIRIMHDR